MTRVHAATGKRLADGMETMMGVCLLAVGAWGAVASSYIPPIQKVCAYPAIPFAEGIHDGAGGLLNQKVMPC